MADTYGADFVEWAKRLKEDTRLQALLNEMEQDCVDMWKSRGPGDTAGREEAWINLTAVHKLRDRMTSIATSKSVEQWNQRAQRRQAEATVSEKA
jgi:hypothetical protein